MTRKYGCLIFCYLHLSRSAEWVKAAATAYPIIAAELAILPDIRWLTSKELG